MDSFWNELNEDWNDGELNNKVYIGNPKNAPYFYVIFNPWNDDGDDYYDEDVFNPAFTENELEHYISGNEGYNYYPDGVKVNWIIKPANPRTFLTAIDAISGERYAESIVAKLVSFNSLHYIVPNGAYWIRMNEKAVLKYP